MDTLLSSYSLNLSGFLLVLVRMSGIFILSPIFGGRSLPTYFKIGIAFFCSLIVLNTIDVKAVHDISNIYIWALMVAKELLIGLTIGYVTALFFSAFFIAGQIIDTQIGFGIVNVIDPQNNIQVPIVGNLYNIIALLVFFALNGHHILIKALFDSYKYIPLGQAMLDVNTAHDIIDIFSHVLIISVKISLPVVAVTLLVDVAMGIFARTIPQMNVFILGIPAKIILGLIVILLFIPFFVYFLDGVFGQMLNDLGNVIKRMIPG
ncbi:MAG: flagellar biosynthetic protein FliR [Clostridia bacterium]|nr:flagellar biosynthetic protein FliR [Clostridia bacterium]